MNDGWKERGSKTIRVHFGSAEAKRLKKGHSDTNNGNKLMWEAF